MARLLLSFGEAMLTCALVTLLVVWQPQWLATWSDRLYLAEDELRSLPRRP